jgi:transposase
MSQAEVARRCELSRTTTMRWLRAFEESGVADLSSKGSRGRKSRLRAANLRKLERILLQGPLKSGYRTDLWTLSRVTEVIRKATCESYHLG